MKLWLNDRLSMGLAAWNTAINGEDYPAYPLLGLEYPAGAGIEHLYEATPMITGVVDGDRRRWVTGRSTIESGPEQPHPYSNGERIWHTSILNFSEPNRRDVDDDADGQIDEDALDGRDNDGDWTASADDVGADGIADPLESGCRGGYHAVFNPDPAFDDYDTTATDSCHPNASGKLRRKNDRALFTELNGIADHGEPHVDEDYAAVSESDYYLAATDTVKISGYATMGLKLIQRSYAWSSRVGEGILPMEYVLVNIGTNVIRNGTVGMFVDADVGPRIVPSYFVHDYACAFDTLRTVYAHNPIDQGSTPLGVSLLSGWRSLADMGFGYFIYDFSRPALDADYQCFFFGCDYPPVGYGCSDPNHPQDTRWNEVFGRFDVLAPGDSLTFHIAFVSGSGLDDGPLSMKENLRRAVVLQRRGYHVPSPPPSPRLRIEATQARIRLDWSWDGSSPNPLDAFDLYDSTLQALPDTHWRRRDNPDALQRGGRSFEGFKVWRSSSAEFDSSTFVELARFDVADDLGYGEQTGLRFSYTDTTASPGRTYWYAVTSYAVPGNVTLPVMPGDPVGYAVYAPGFESGLSENATRLLYGFDATAAPGKALVVPNPYRADNKYPGGEGLPAFEGAHHGDNGLVWFLHLPAKATIRVFSLAGDAIATIDHDDAARASRGQYTGQEEWRLASDSGLPLASGVYVFSVESDRGTQIGKFVVLR
jgi:hypothetical protein